jgi:hypothetical protein
MLTGGAGSPRRRCRIVDRLQRIGRAKARVGSGWSVAHSRPSATSGRSNRALSDAGFGQRGGPQISIMAMTE